MRLPVKTPAHFNLALQPSVKREQVESLHELGFLGRQENVVLLGPPGVGKTYLPISLTIAPAEGGRRFYFGTLAGLIESPEEAKAAGQLARRLKALTHPALLVVDEIGCLSLLNVCNFSIAIDTRGVKSRSLTPKSPFHAALVPQIKKFQCMLDFLAGC